MENNKSDIQQGFLGIEFCTNAVTNFLKKNSIACIQIEKIEWELSIKFFLSSSQAVHIYILRRIPQFRHVLSTL